MVSLPLHGEIQAVNGDNMVTFNNIIVVINIYIGQSYLCMGYTY